MTCKKKIRGCQCVRSWRLGEGLQMEKRGLGFQCYMNVSMNSLVIARSVQNTCGKAEYLFFLHIIFVPKRRYRITHWRSVTSPSLPHFSVLKHSEITFIFTSCVRVYFQNVCRFSGLWFSSFYLLLVRYSCDAWTALTTHNWHFRCWRSVYPVADILLKIWISMNSFIQHRPCMWCLAEAWHAVMV